jgi:hypothetical protein
MNIKLLLLYDAANTNLFFILFVSIGIFSQIGNILEQPADMINHNNSVPFFESADTISGNPLWIQTGYSCPKSLFFNSALTSIICS